MGETSPMPSAHRKFPIGLALLCLLLIAKVGLAQSTPDQSQTKIPQLLQQQVGMDDALPDDKNPDGTHFVFSKIDESSGQSGRLLRFRVHVPGAPKKQKYVLALLKIGADPQVIVDEVYVNAKGLLMVHRPRPDQDDKDSVEDADEVDVAVGGARGEPVRFVLASTDKKLLIPGTIVPFPIEAKDGNCKLEARLGLPNGEAVLFYADGLSPNTEVPVQMVSAGEVEKGKFSVNAKGHAVTIDLPFVDGKQYGTVKAALAEKGCSVSVEIPWGKGSYKPL